MRLPDGTVVPHYMNVRDTSQARGAPGFFSEVALLVGEVTEIFPPSDPNNVSGKFNEYVVLIWRRQRDGSLERLSFRCSQAETFGGLGDWFRFSFRASTSDPSKDALANGSTVLVACINGDRSNAYIISAVPHPNRTQKDPEGRALTSRFNGVEMKVNDDGSFELLVPGPTDENGNPVDRDADNHGSKLTFSANGDIAIDDQNGDSVKVSPGSKSIEVTSGDKLTEKSDDIEVEGGSVWKLTAPKVVVISPDIRLGADEELLDPSQGVVHGQGLDTFTGLPYFALGNASTIVKAKKE